jgi:exosortase
VRVPFGLAVAALLGLVGLAFWAPYMALAPLAGSESPQSVLLLAPPLAALLIWRGIAQGGREGNELTANLMLASPIVLTLVALVAWFPARLSYSYWVYRFDLLAVPLFVAVAILLLFGAGALWRCRLAIGVLLLGWPPVVDTVVGFVSSPLANVQARMLELLPLSMSRSGDAFTVGSGAHRSVIVIGSPCAGMLGVLSMGLVGGVIVYVCRGSRARKLTWLAIALVAALAVNVARLAIVLAVAATSGTDRAFSVFHAMTGFLLFGALLFGLLFLLRPLGLELSLRVPRPAAPLSLRLPVAMALVVVLGLLAVLTGWMTSGASAGPGLFRGVAQISTADLLPTPAGLRTSGVDQLPSLSTLFGSGAHSALYHLRGSDGLAVAAQVVVVPSFSQVRRYGVLECFVFHQHGIYATHVAPLAGGGTGVLTALRLDGSDVATLTWIQPVLLDGHHAWRRIVLFAYLSGARPSGAAPRSASAPSFATWLLNTLGPYGDTHPPARFVSTEKGLVQLADRFVKSKVAA